MHRVPILISIIGIIFHLHLQVPYSKYVMLKIPCLRWCGRECRQRLEAARVNLGSRPVHHSLIQHWNMGRWCRRTRSNRSGWLGEPRDSPIICWECLWSITRARSRILGPVIGGIGAASSQHLNGGKRERWVWHLNSSRKSAPRCTVMLHMWKGNIELNVKWVICIVDWKFRALL